MNGIRPYSFSLESYDQELKSVQAQLKHFKSELISQTEPTRTSVQSQTI